MVSGCFSIDGDMAKYADSIWKAISELNLNGLHLDTVN